MVGEFVWDIIEAIVEDKVGVKVEDIVRLVWIVILLDIDGALLKIYHHRSCQLPTVFAYEFGMSCSSLLKQEFCMWNSLGMYIKS